MKKFFVIVTVSLFLSAVCAPIFSLSAQEPQKKECSKEVKCCDKKAADAKGCTQAEKKACAEADKKAADKKDTKKADKKKK